MHTVKASTTEENYQTLLTAGQHQIVADEPIDNGGKDTGFTPKELLASSLASCTAITLKMYADRKDWKTGEISVTVDLNENEDKSYAFFRKISIQNELSVEQHKRILSVANACPVHKILSGTISIATQLS